MFLRSKLRRNCRKMEEIELTSIQTPTENVSFEEARIIFECNLIQITTPQLGDFYNQEVIDWLRDTYKQANDVRKYVYGEIIHAWVRK